MTELAEDFISNFLSHKEYDPEKAHEYYMRTRELKGRKPPAAKVPSYTSKHHQMDAALRKLGEGAKDRAKAMPKLTSTQISKAKKWIQTAEKYDSVYKSSGMEKKELAILDSDMPDAQKNSSLHALYKNPVYQRLDKARDALFKTFLAKPEIMRYYEILDSQGKQKQAKLESDAFRKLLIKPGKKRDVQL